MFKQFLMEEEGQTTVEYLLIIAVVVVVIAALGKGMQAQVKTLVDNVFKGVNSEVTKLMSQGGTQ